LSVSACFFFAYFVFVFFFFFQAEDGIRDYKVTGVQTCALPISGLCTNQPTPGSAHRQRVPSGGIAQRHAAGVWLARSRSDRVARAESGDARGSVAAVPGAAGRTTGLGLARSAAPARIHSG